MAFTYTTTDLVQAELRAETPFSTNTYPSLQDVNDWIEEESAYINAIAAMTFGSTVVVDEYVDLSGDDDILLPNSPILSITSLSYNVNRIGSPDGTDWEVKTEDSDFIVYPDVGRIHILREQWKPKPGRRRVKVSYVHGYPETPLIVRKLASKLVAKRVIDSLLFSKINEGDTGEVSIGTVRVMEPRDLSIPVYRQLDEDIYAYKKRLTDGFKVFRPIAL